MSAHPSAYAHLADRLRGTTDPAARDALLDQWLDYRERATEWDADQWGLSTPADDPTPEGPPMAVDACRNCRRPLHWLPGVGWLHGELPQYAGEDITCDTAHPVCVHGTCDHGDGPDPDCACRCHRPATERKFRP